MTPPPTAVGMALCDYVILEEGTKKFSPIGIFGKLGLESFPGIAHPFSVFAMLTDGHGLGRIQLVVSREDSEQEIFAVQSAAYFPDRLSVLIHRFRVRNCHFSQPGQYLFNLFVDEQWVAQRRVEVYLREQPA